MIPVEDSKIKAIGYGAGKSQLHIQFVGGLYIFDEVPEPLFESMMLAKIKFAFFRENIQGIYPHRKVTRDHKTRQ